jgi:hypothetical protein
MRSRLLLLVVCLSSFGWLAPSRASAGPFTANGTQPMLAHPVQSSASCTGCHGNYDVLHDIEPGPTWEGSLMGQAGRDPIFWAALDVANHDVPGVGDFCLRCHAVSGWLAGRSEPPGGSVDGCALVGNIDQQNTDFDGVTCHVCHRMEPNAAPPMGQQSVYLDNGQFWLDDGTCGGQGEPCRFGPYDYANGGLTAAPHVWAPSSYLTSSDMCGNCHNVTSPAFNLIVGGIDAGIKFPIERTHREWEQSAFALPGTDFQTCQDCHMPNATNDPAYASNFFLNNHTGNMGIHAFAGGNAWVPEVLRAEYPALGIDASLAASADFARAMLASAADVDVVLPAAAHPGGDLTAQVSVTNLSGHKLPTGYPEGRRMWLHVEARDTAGTLVFESGAYDTATGVLTRDAQVKVYESKQGVWNVGTGECETEAAGKDQFHFVLNNCVELDNRIPPKGFTGGADLETNPVGYTYPEITPGVLSNTDVTTYTIPVPVNANMPITVTATLRYQTISKEYVDFLRDEAVDNGFPNDCISRSTGPVGDTRAGVLHDMWATHGRAAPVTMASAAATMPVDPFVCAKTKISKGTAKPAAVLGVAVTDAFGSGTIDAKVLGHLCAPATIGGGSLLDADTHLTAFKLKGTAGAPQTGLHLTDRFGTLTVDTKKPALLLSPTALGAVPPVRSAHSVDDFTCYKAAITKKTPKLAKGLQAEIASAFGPTRTVDLKSLAFVCAATDRGDGRKNPDARLACYKAKPAKDEPKMTASSSQAIASDLAAATVDALSDALVCVPATTTP